MFSCRIPGLSRRVSVCVTQVRERGSPWLRCGVLTGLGGALVAGGVVEDLADLLQHRGEPDDSPRAGQLRVCPDPWTGADRDPG